MITRRILIEQTNTSGSDKFTVTIETDIPSSILIGEYAAFESAVDAAIAAARAISISSGGGFLYNSMQIKLLSTFVTD